MTHTDPFAEAPGLKEAKRATAEAFWDPQPGDRFHEMLAYWVYVVGRDGDVVTILEAGAPCTFPTGQKVKAWRGTVEEFGERFSYGSIVGFWVYLSSRGENVEGWLAVAEEKLRAVV
jgi:hypothetical protein